MDHTSPRRIDTMADMTEPVKDIARSVVEEFATMYGDPPELRLRGDWTLTFEMQVFLNEE